MPASPGLPPAWGARAGVYGGVVNLGNGNLTLQVPLVGWADGMSFALVFNSQANPSQPSPIAPKWTHSWNVFIEVSPDRKQATVQEGDGSRWVYRDPDLDGVYTPPTGIFDRLERKADDRYELTHKGSEARWVFGASGSVRWLEQVVDRYGQAMTLSYAGGRLSQVVDRYGRALELIYDGGRLWKVRNFTGREWELVYDGARLQKVRYPAVEDEEGRLRVYEVAWGYDSRGNVVSWQDRLGQVWRYGYLSRFSDALKWFQDPAGNQWRVDYSGLGAIDIGTGEISKTGSSRWVDPTGVWVEYGFASSGVVVRITQGGNATSERLTTRLWYNGQRQVVKRQDPAGLVWEWGYDSVGNLLRSKEPNGAQMTYTYYPDSDKVWKVTNALEQVWEYTYTSYGDVKSVKDPEGAVMQYVYDYELGEPAYGQVRKVIDARNRETVYEYYPADDANLARRGQVKRVVVPGGFWRELDYGGAGWLTRRTVQVSDGTETTTYTYDNWGRLRGVDYPRSADVRMGFDGEGRRVWVEDGVGRRQYTYNAWGRVVRQEGCCGSAEGIEVQVVTAEYDSAGRKLFEKERRSDESVVRAIGHTYDALGRLQSVGDYRGSVVYSYEAGTGRLKREDYPNSSYVEYTYYGSDNPSQMGFVWKVEHKRLDGSLLIGYEYTYDLLGRVVSSVERPSGDATSYTYTPAGRLESEVRTGQVAYSRSYGYNPDGSRAFVDRTDALNGTHWDFYSYDAQTGRLASVVDVWSGEVNEFEWNPEGTLARWSDGNAEYDRVYSYDEEGRLVQIERDYGGGNVQLAYRYGYSSDGVRVWKQDVLNGQEYRYVCRIGCGGVPMRVYQREISGEDTWYSTDFLAQGTLVISSSGFTHRGSQNVDIVSDENGQLVDRFLVDRSGEMIDSRSFVEASDEGATEVVPGALVLTRFQITLQQQEPPRFTNPRWRPDPYWPYPPPWTPTDPLPPGECKKACDKAYDTCVKLVDTEYDNKMKILSLACTSGGLGGVLACAGICSKIPSPWCWGIFIAVVALVTLGCAVAAKIILEQYGAARRSCYDKWEACVRGCLPKPKKSRDCVAPQALMVCPMY